MSQLAARAADLAAAGMAVFPCQPHTKTPLDNVSVREATSRQTQVHHWWDLCPAANIGMRTGTGVFEVIDIDLNHPAGAQTHEQLATNRLLDHYIMRVVTPSGGLHYYFDQSTGTAHPTRLFPEAGVSYLGEGGWVLVPPSRISGPAINGTYTVDHMGPSPTNTGIDYEELVKLLAPQSQPQSIYDNPRVKGIMSKLEQLPPGGLTPKYLAWAATKLHLIGVRDFEPLAQIAQIQGLSPGEITAALTLEPQYVQSHLETPLNQPFQQHLGI